MKMNVKKFANKKLVACAALIAAGVTTAMAQGNGLAGINEATSMVTSYFEPGTKLIYAIGAVVGLIGGVKVYGKFSSGDPDTSKTAASWFGACIFLIVAATILEFKGLKAQYLFIFAGGLLAVFVLFVILYLAGVNQWVCIGTGVVSASVLIWQAFALNRRYGEHGLMKRMANRQHPRFLINRRKPYLIIKNKYNDNEEYAESNDY